MDNVGREDLFYSDVYEANGRESLPWLLWVKFYLSRKAIQFLQ